MVCNSVDTPNAYNVFKNMIATLMICMVTLIETGIIMLSANATTYITTPIITKSEYLNPRQSISDSVIGTDSCSRIAMSLTPSKFPRTQLKGGVLYNNRKASGNSVRNQKTGDHKYPMLSYDDNGTSAVQFAKVVTLLDRKHSSGSQESLSPG